MSPVGSAVGQQGRPKGENVALRETGEWPPRERGAGPARSRHWRKSPRRSSRPRVSTAKPDKRSICSAAPPRRRGSPQSWCAASLPTSTAPVTMPGRVTRPRREKPAGPGRVVRSTPARPVTAHLRCELCRRSGRRWDRDHSPHPGAGQATVPRRAESSRTSLDTARRWSQDHSYHPGAWQAPAVQFWAETPSEYAVRPARLPLPRSTTGSRFDPVEAVVAPGSTRTAARRRALRAPRPWRRRAPGLLREGVGNAYATPFAGGGPPACRDWLPGCLRWLMVPVKNPTDTESQDYSIPTVFADSLTR